MMKFDSISSLKFYLKDIRFWIIFFFITRLYGITLPPLEVAHHWRQTDVLMIARNFYENDANIFFPKVDVAGEKSGIVGSELPLLNYLIYLISKILRYEHWYGRIIVLIFSSLGSYYFYKSIKLFFDEQIAFNSTIVLTVSLWFSYSRKIIPDTFAISLCIISLYSAFMYFKSGRIRHLISFFVLGALGCLSKILACTILTILIFPIFNYTYPLSRKVFVSIFSLLIFTLVCAWYFIWVPYLNNKYQFAEHFYMGTTYLNGLFEMKAHLFKILNRLFITPLKFTGLAVFIYSIYVTIKNKNYEILRTFIVPYLAFIIVLIKTGAALIGDRYYLITLVPSMAFISGYGLSQIKSKQIATIILIVVSIEGIADQIHDFRIRQPYKSLTQLESIMDSFSKKEDLIAANGEIHDPTVLYFAHRRGWNIPTENLSNTDVIDQIKNKGCRYIVITKKLNGNVQLNLPFVYDSEYFRIYQL